MLTSHLGFSWDLLIRLGMALLVGVVLGLNRWLHHKSAGIRTHSLVAIGSALAMLLIDSMPGADVEASSRVVQGLLTGIGFLGAGVIIHEGNSKRIHGLTTAASVWACALLGATFGSGEYALGGTALLMIMLVLIFGGRVERMTGALMGIDQESEVPNEQEDK